MTPFHHPAFKASHMPAPGFWPHIEAACRKEGIVLILDDIRAGFRLDLHGSHKVFGFEPDLICFCKAIANGHALSATLGRKELRVAASKVFLTGSFWNSAPAMAAALACLGVMERDDTVSTMRRTGEHLMNGLIAAAQRHGYEMIATGPPAMPFPVFAHDPDLRRQQRFCGEVTRRGALFHPHHNWFLSAAHQPAHIEATLAMADEALALMRSERL